MKRCRRKHGDGDHERQPNCRDLLAILSQMGAYVFFVFSVDVTSCTHISLRSWSGASLLQRSRAKETLLTLTSNEGWKRRGKLAWRQELAQ